MKTISLPLFYGLLLGLCLLSESCQKEEVNLQQQYANGGVLTYWLGPNRSNPTPESSWRLVASQMRADQPKELYRISYGSFSKQWSNKARTIFHEKGTLNAVGLDGRVESIEANIDLDNLSRDLQWTPDERYLAMTINSGRRLVIYDLVEQTYVYQSEEPPLNDRYYFSDIQWSPDGRKLAFLKRSFNSASNARLFELMALDLDNGPLARTLFSDSMLIDDDFQWGPDAQYIYRPDYSTIFRYRIDDGYTEEVLEMPLTRLSGPVLSPDSRFLLISCLDLLQNKIFLKKVDLQSRETEDIQEGFCQGYTWSKDGLSLMYYFPSENVMKIDRLDDEKPAQSIHRFELGFSPQFFSWLQK